MSLFTRLWPARTAHTHLQRILQGNAGMKTSSIVLFALAALAVFGGLSAYIWVSMGDVSISWMGLLAMVLGVVLSLALGIGLMALVYFSNKRGYDDEAGR